jgi:hypothetical protein
MAELKYSQNAEDVTQNLDKLHSYAFGSPKERKFHFDRIYNAEHLVYSETPDGPIFAPVKWCTLKKKLH